MNVKHWKYKNLWQDSHSESNDVWHRFNSWLKFRLHQFSSSMIRISVLLRPLPTSTSNTSIAWSSDVAVAIVRHSPSTSVSTVWDQYRGSIRLRFSTVCLGRLTWGARKMMLPHNRTLYGCFRLPGLLLFLLRLLKSWIYSAPVVSHINSNHLLQEYIIYLWAHQCKRP